LWAYGQPGFRSYNMRLSIHRAKAVASYFKEHGIAADRILDVKGFGETKPVVPNTSPANMQKNRRVELKFKKEK
ncbi:MAG TPA: OmpA family protein, partial [Sunxiuqinia sp.]|nr:OmpA family protein [Sunxiuqinia sp.]